MANISIDIRLCGHSLNSLYYRLYIYLCMYVYIHIYICARLCMYVYKLYIIHICIYTYIHRRAQDGRGFLWCIARI